MSAKIVPTDDQVIQQNLDRLKSILKLPTKYHVDIYSHWMFPLEHGLRHTLKDTSYIIRVGKLPREVTISNNDAGLFRKETFRDVTRYMRIAQIDINPHSDRTRNKIVLTGTDEENQLITDLLDKASHDWVFERGEIKEIVLHIHVFPESESNYFDLNL